MKSCVRCDTNTHRCPGCGESVPHGQIACGDCDDPITNAEPYYATRHQQSQRVASLQGCEPERNVLGLNELAHEVHETAKSKGWWTPDKVHGVYIQRSFGDQVANFHAEVSEAWEQYRDGHGFTEVYYKHEDGTRCRPDVMCKVGVNQGNPKPEGIPIELADVIIRILDTCARYGIDIDEAIAIKMTYNKTRPHRHGGKLA